MKDQGTMKLLTTLLSSSCSLSLPGCFAGVDFLGRPVVVFVGRHFQVRNIDLNKVFFLFVYLVYKTKMF